MLFDDIFKNPKWSGKDFFPSSAEWKNEINNWFLFINGKNQLNRYVPRLNDSTTRRDEALAEIFSAYFLETILNYEVINWEQRTISNNNVDFVVCSTKDKIYCEVKSPGWEAELKNNEQLSGRKALPKHLEGEVRFPEPWQRIRYAIKKSYQKFLPTEKNLLIIHDDLFVSLLEDFSRKDINIVLFEEKGIYNNEIGYFVNSAFSNIGGILFIDCRYVSKIEYRCRFIANINAQRKFFMNTISN